MCGFNIIRCKIVISNSQSAIKKWRSPTRSNLMVLSFKFQHSKAIGLGVMPNSLGPRTGLRKLCDSARVIPDMYGNLVILIEREIGLLTNWQPQLSTSLYRDDVASGCTQNYFVIKLISCSMFF